MFRSGLVNTLVTHANIKGFGLTPLSGDRRGYMPPLLKINKTKSRRKSHAHNSRSNSTPRIPTLTPKQYHSISLSLGSVSSRVDQNLH